MAKVKMEKKINIFLTLTLLLSMTVQGVKMFICHSENSVHLESSCCAVEESESCCEEKPDASESEIRSRCCSELTVEFVKTTNSCEIEALDLNIDEKGPFYLPVISQEIDIAEYLTVNSSEANKAPPSDKSHTYIFINSFLC